MLAVSAQVKADKDSIQALVQPIETADRLFQEIQTLQQQVDELVYKLEYQGQGAKSLKDIESELNGLRSREYDF